MGCLHPTVETVRVSDEQGFVTRVRKLLQQMINKVSQDTPLSSDEIAFLNSTPLPIYKMLSVQSAFSQTADVFNLDYYAEVIATDLLFRYLANSLQLVSESIQLVHFPEAQAERYFKQLAAVTRAVKDLQGDAYQRLANQLSLIEQTQHIEKLLAGHLSTNMLESLNWSGDENE